MSLEVVCVEHRMISSPRGAQVMEMEIIQRERGAKRTLVKTLVTFATTSRGLLILSVTMERMIARGVKVWWGRWVGMVM